MKATTPVTTGPLRAAAELATLDGEALAAALRPLWEDAPWLTKRLAGRSFDSWEALVDAAEAEITAGSADEKADLLSAHPRLGRDKAALKATSAASWAEQGGDRSPGEQTSERLASLNDEYERRFGFPFVEWVRGRPLEAIVPVIEERLEHDRETELEAGCAALVAIARDRLARLQRAPCPPTPTSESAP